MLIKDGTQTGTTANIDVDLGVIPVYVRVMNVCGLAVGEWTDEFPDASILKTITDGTMTFDLTGGITPLGDDGTVTVTASDTTTDGDETTYTGVRGFRIGTDSDINACGEIIKYVAYCRGHDSD